MKTIIALISFSFIVLSCNSGEKTTGKVQVKKTKNYELHKVQNSKAVLVLFPGGGNSIKMTKGEFKILPKAIENDISVLILNFNRHLWINDRQTRQLSTKIEEVFRENNLNTAEVYIGGMSIGGNVSLSLSNFLIQSNSLVHPKGVFIVDSPIDLLELYQSCTKDIANPKLSKDRKAESKWIVSYYEESFGKDSILQNIPMVSPFTLSVGKNNINELKETKLRFYTEPDSVWWKETRMTDYENTNAYSIQQISKKLNEEDWLKFELIETRNKGYRANGDRNPHSWSIVDIDELILWIKDQRK